MLVYSHMVSGTVMSSLHKSSVLALILMHSLLSVSTKLHYYTTQNSITALVPKQVIIHIECSTLQQETLTNELRQNKL